MTDDNNLNNNNDLNKNNNNPFIHNGNKISLNHINNQVSNKRQWANFNLGKLNEENSINIDSIGSIANITSEQKSISAEPVIENKDKEFSFNKNNKNNNNKNENIFCEALKKMSNYNIL